MFEVDLFLLDVPDGHEVAVYASGDTYPVVNIVDRWGFVLKTGSWNESLSYVKGADPIYALVYGYGGNTGDYDIALTSDEVKLVSNITTASSLNNPIGGYYSIIAANDINKQYDRKIIEIVGSTQRIQSSDVLLRYDYGYFIESVPYEYTFNPNPSNSYVTNYILPRFNIEMNQMTLIIIQI